jgi:hypothetical protein
MGSAKAELVTDLKTGSAPEHWFRNSQRFRNGFRFRISKDLEIVRGLGIALYYV